MQLRRLFGLCGISLSVPRLKFSSHAFTRRSSVNLNFMPRNALIDKAKAPRSREIEEPNNRETP